MSQKERNMEFAFWHVLKKKYVDINGQVIENKPKYCGIYGLGSYGAVGKEVQKAIKG